MVIRFCVHYIMLYITKKAHPNFFQSISWIPVLHLFLLVFISLADDSFLRLMVATSIHAQVTGFPFFHVPSTQHPNHCPHCYHIRISIACVHTG